MNESNIKDENLQILKNVEPANQNKLDEENLSIHLVNSCEDKNEVDRLAFSNQQDPTISEGSAKRPPNTSENKSSKQRFCKMCGGIIDGQNKKCVSCGKQYLHFPKKAGIRVIIVIVIVILAGLNIYHFAIDKWGITVAVDKDAEVGESKSIPFSDDSAAINNVASSVVMLQCYDISGNMIASGSGFLAFNSRTIVTNFHVLEDAYSITAVTENDKSYSIQNILAYNTDQDIALVYTGEDTGLSPLTIGDSDKLQKGDKVVAIGSPLGIKNTISTGIISGLITNGYVSEIQFTAAISSGSSGGALLDDNGSVIGVTYASYTEGQNLNLAVPMNLVKSIQNEAMNTKELTVAELYNLYKPYGNTATNILGDGVLAEDAENIAYIKDRAIIIENKQTANETRIPKIAKHLNIYHNRLYFVDENKNDIGSCNLDGTDITYANLLSSEKVESPFAKNYMVFKEDVSEMLVMQNKLIFILTTNLPQKPYFESQLFILNLENFTVEYTMNDVSQFLYYDNDLYYANGKMPIMNKLHLADLQETRVEIPEVLYLDGVTTNGTIYLHNEPDANDIVTYYSLDCKKGSLSILLTQNYFETLPHLYTVNDTVVLIEAHEIDGVYVYYIYEITDGNKQLKISGENLLEGSMLIYFGVFEGKNNLLFSDNLVGPWHTLLCDQWSIEPILNPGYIS